MSVVLISSNAADGEALASVIVRHGHRVTVVADAAQLRVILDACRSVLAFVCLRGSGRDPEVLGLLKNARKRTGAPVIIVAPRLSDSKPELGDFVFTEPLHQDRLVSVLRSLSRLRR